MVVFGETRVVGGFAERLAFLLAESVKLNFYEPVLGESI
jgi:hypothetical protein